MEDAHMAEVVFAPLPPQGKEDLWPRGGGVWSDREVWKCSYRNNVIYGAFYILEQVFWNKLESLSFIYNLFFRAHHVALR